MELKDKVPPHNLEAEQAVLGAILLNWRAMDDVSSIISSEDFYSSQNAEIFKALKSLSLASVQGDLLTLIDELTKTGALEKAGGISYVSSLCDVVPTSANAENYATIVHELSVRRTLIRV